MVDLGHTLFAQALEAQRSATQAAMEQKREQDRLRREQNVQTSGALLDITKQLGQAQDAAFQRSLKEAEMQGKLAALQGQQAPQLTSSQQPYGQLAFQETSLQKQLAEQEASRQAERQDIVNRLNLAQIADYEAKQRRQEQEIQTPAQGLSDFEQKRQELSLKKQQADINKTYAEISKIKQSERKKEISSAVSAPPGVVYPTDIEKVDKRNFAVSWDSANQALQNVARIQELLASAPPGSRTPIIGGMTPEGREANSLATDLLLQIKELANLGVMSKTDFDLIERKIPKEPLNVKNPNVEIQLNTVANTMRKALKSKAKAFGIQLDENIVGNPKLQAELNIQQELTQSESDPFESFTQALD